jgi:hypothetical protein
VKIELFTPGPSLLREYSVVKRSKIGQTALVQMENFREIGARDANLCVLFCHWTDPIVNERTLPPLEKDGAAARSVLATASAALP